MDLEAPKGVKALKKGGKDFSRVRRRRKDKRSKKSDRGNQLQTGLYGRLRNNFEESCSLKRHRLILPSSSIVENGGFFSEGKRSLAVSKSFSSNSNLSGDLDHPSEDVPKYDILSLLSKPLKKGKKKKSNKNKPCAVFDEANKENIPPSMMDNSNKSSNNSDNSDNSNSAFVKAMDESLAKLKKKYYPHLNLEMEACKRISKTFQQHHNGLTLDGFLNGDKSPPEKPNSLEQLYGGLAEVQRSSDVHLDEPVVLQPDFGFAENVWPQQDNWQTVSLPVYTFDPEPPEFEFAQNNSPPPPLFIQQESFNSNNQEFWANMNSWEEEVEQQQTGFLCYYPL